LHDSAAKKGSGRMIPMHPELRDALADLRQVAAHSEHVVTSERGGAMTALAIVVWFNRAFRKIGLKGCSSHSGRRTFVTRAARLVHKAGDSLRDVQLLAGHRSIQTTQRYILYQPSLKVTLFASDSLARGSVIRCLVSGNDSRGGDGCDGAIAHGL
jgi:integrase/recombinase XerD